MKLNQRELEQIQFLAKRGYTVTPKTMLLPQVKGKRWLLPVRYYEVAFPSFHNLPHVD